MTEASLLKKKLPSLLKNRPSNISNNVSHKLETIPNKRPNKPFRKRVNANTRKQLRNRPNNNLKSELIHKKPSKPKINSFIKRDLSNNINSPKKSIIDESFDHIYVINLRRSKDRRQHMASVFKNMNITNYAFFEASTPHSPSARQLRRSHRIQSTWIREGRWGNWCSFIRVWKDIVKNQYKLVLICEDDLHFRPQAKEIFNTLFDKSKLENFDFNRPLLLKLGSSGYRAQYCKQKKIQWVPNNFFHCNPCYAINWHAAKVLLNGSKVIKQTSDLYAHKVAAKKMQSYIATPLPIHDLSWDRRRRKFSSTVR